MPWHIKQNSSKCPKSKPYAVIQDNNGKLMGCHATKAGAQKQIAALYANEGKSAMNRKERREGRPQGGERTAPFTLRATDDDEPNDGRTLDGYAAVFNRRTKIVAFEGDFMEQIAPRSMAKSFRESPPIVQFDHGRHPLIGSFPIADLKSAREESDPELAPEGGAHMIARMFDHLFFEPLRMAIKARAVKGMSFRFEVIREVWHRPDGTKIKDEDLFEELRKTWSGELDDDELPIRTMQELRVPELGPVVWPAYKDTSISVRASDLGRPLADLDTDPELRAIVVRKLFTVPDLGELKRDNDAPQTTDSRADETAGEHPSKSNDAPQATDSRADETAGEHPSPSNNKRSNNYRLTYQLRELAKMTRKEASL